MNDFSTALFGNRYRAIQQLASGVQTAFDRVELDVPSESAGSGSSVERFPGFGALVAVIANPLTAGDTVIELLLELEQPRSGMGMLLVPSGTPSRTLGNVEEGLKRFGVVTRRSKSNQASEMKAEAHAFLESHKKRVLAIERQSKIR